MSIKVLHVYTSLHVGGIESWLARLPQYLPEDIQLYYYMFNGRGALADEAERRGAVVLSPSRCPPARLPEHLALPPLLARAVSAIRPHVIHTHMEWPMHIAALARVLAGSTAALVGHLHNRPHIPKGSLVWFVHRWARKRADMILYVSCHVA